MVQERYARVCLAVAGLLAGVFATHADPGGLDKQGCHANRKTGEHHCHRDVAPARAAPRAPAVDPRWTPAAPSRLRELAPSHTFRNCDDARAHGAAPVRRGDPGYGPHLDRDNDGVGCEPYRGR